RFNRIIRFDPMRPCVTVQPGILLAELNGYLAERGMRIAPDPGSQDLCRIGGMVGHNASGYRSVKYGQTKDHVLSLRVALVDGTVLDARDVRVDDPEWNLVAKQVPSLERVRAEIEVHRKAILSSRRPIRKHSCGYQLATIANVVGPISARYQLSRPAEVAEDPHAQAALWKLRRSVFPTIIQRPGTRKAWGFVEDPIVPRDRVPEFIEFLVGLTRRHSTVAGIYGHIGDGNTHYRPLFDPTDPADFERMRALREDFDDAVLDRFHGA